MPEIVTAPDQDDDAIVTDPTSATVRPADIRVTVVNIYSAARAVATHRHTKRLARNTSYVGLGGYALCRQMIDSRPVARYNRMIAAAELSGQHAAALDWDRQKLLYLEQRH